MGVPTAIDPAPAMSRRARPRLSAGRAGAAVRRWQRELGADTGLLLTSAVVFLLSWPLPNLDAQPGLDPSWAIALHQAVHYGMDFGPDVLFTYGPLGFLRQPVLVWPETARLAFAYAMITHFALVLALVWGLRRSTRSLLLAGVIALFVAGLITVQPITKEPIFVVAFAAALALVDRARSPRSATALAAALGLLGGIELLAKFNSGVTIAVLGATAIAFGPRPVRRPAIAFAATYALAAAAGWIATGQPLTNIPSFLTGEIGVASGYSEAMGIQATPDTLWVYWATFPLLAIGAIAAWVCGPREGRAGRLAVWTVFAFFAFKAGFVRFGLGHPNIFFTCVVGALCMFQVPRRHRGVAVVTALFALSVTFGAIRSDPAASVHPLARAEALLDQVRILSDGSATNEQIAAGRTRVAQGYGLDPASYALVRDRTVHVDPVDAGLAWALRLPWDPVPIFQTYSAYTHDLDRRNAEKLSGPDAPERILRDGTVVIDERNTAWDSPAAMRAMLCHYRSMSVVGRWQVLERVPNRCGEPREILEVKAPLGESIDVPATPDRTSVLIAEVDGLAVTGFESLRAAAVRALPRSVTIDDARSYRVVPGTAGAGLVLEVPRSPGGYPTGFSPDLTAQYLRFTKGSDPEQPGDEVTVRFLAMPIR